MELGSGGEEEAALEAASGVESTNSEVSLSCCLVMVGTWEVKLQNVESNTELVELVDRELGK